MDTPHYCRVCKNLRPRSDGKTLKIFLATLLEMRRGRCQICDVLCHMVQAQPERRFLTESLKIYSQDTGSPLELHLFNKPMTFCIYSISEETSRMLSIPCTRARNCGLELNNYEDSFKFIRNCLADCTAGENGHESCESQPISPLPRRLLHIGPSNMRLIEPQGEFGKYAALSYCWGTQPQKHLRTSSSNLEKMKTSISWEDLPPVFKDAVTVLNNLDIELVWIDSLCIVQDSVRESSKMAQYYAGAYFTIAADSSGNPDVPFLGRLHPIYQPFGSSVGPHTIFCERIPHFSDIFSDDINALLQRGWALQELALSNRALHYQACGLVWECRSMIKPQHEMEMALFPSYPNGGLSQTFSRLLAQNDGDERHAGNYSRPMSKWLSEWMDLVSDYSSRSLTLHKDKLPAFSGIASAVFQKTGWTYLAGHWRENLLTSLCWFVSNEHNIRSHPLPTPMPASEGSPSWSWASVNGRVTHRSCYRGPTQFLRAYSKVLGSECILAGLNPFGQTRGGWVTLQGQITVARLSFDSDMHRFFLRPMTKLATFPIRPNIDTLLETCDCTTPIFPGAKTLRRRPASATYDPPQLLNIFVELLLVLQLEGGRRFYLILGRSQTVNGAHVRLGLLEAYEISWRQFHDDELKTPIIVTII